MCVVEEKKWKMEVLLGSMRVWKSKKNKKRSEIVEGERMDESWRKRINKKTDD